MHGESTEKIKKKFSDVFRIFTAMFRKQKEYKTRVLAPLAMRKISYKALTKGHISRGNITGICVILGFRRDVDETCDITQR
jgi:hypothetical protein